MKITKSYLKQIIKEELQKLTEEKDIGEMIDQVGVQLPPSMDVADSEIEAVIKKYPNESVEDIVSRIYDGERGLPDPEPMPVPSKAKLTPEQEAEKAYKELERKNQRDWEEESGFYPLSGLLNIKSGLQALSPEARQLFKQKILADKTNLQFFNSQSGRQDYEDLKAKMKKEFNLR